MRHIKQHGLAFIFLLLPVFAFAQKPDKTGIRYFMQEENALTSKILYGINAAAGHYVRSGDARIYYEVYGKGKPFVVLHGGIVGSPYEMGRFIDSLSQCYQVIAISTRGHGKSGIGTMVPAYEQKAKDVYNVIEQVTKEKVRILGFSDGAYTGYYFAKNYPEKTDKLIAIGAGVWEKGFRDFTIDPQTYFAMDEHYWQQQMTLSSEPERMNEWFSSISSYYNSVDIGANIFINIKIPVLVIAGEKDANAPLETVIAAYKMMPNARLSIIPDAPHPAFIVNFPAVWASITPFLEQKN